MMLRMTNNKRKISKRNGFLLEKTLIVYLIVREVTVIRCICEKDMGEVEVFCV